MEAEITIKFEIVGGTFDAKRAALTVMTDHLVETLEDDFNLDAPGGYEGPVVDNVTAVSSP